MSERSPLDPALATEQVLRAVAPSAPSEDDLTVSARFRERVARQVAEHGPPPPRSHEGTVFRPGGPEPITGSCIGSAENPICVPAVDNVWSCRRCGAWTIVTSVPGPRPALCDCHGGGDVCVHPKPARRPPAGR